MSCNEVTSVGPLGDGPGRGGMKPITTARYAPVWPGTAPETMASMEEPCYNLPDKLARYSTYTQR
ncbi:uncharacterized protein H6S33_006879 [Morchella sextelata]|uniref:uncharacterized protein n=1 Tax=Morchella sextelata TaxID=1174677 RepID=UPI001D0534AA|nr:uncharacterized protein H6S33_006879 [Morchella sextelata]KAH0604502.1 hypothetical protein H6S33_006879 [Morchella sextelata]